jgi:erythromycin esterase
MVRRHSSSEPSVSRDLLAEVRRLSQPLRGPSDLDPLLTRVGNARVVLLGEASHGTHEYYTWRTAITHRLVEEKASRSSRSRATGRTATGSTGS